MIRHALLAGVLLCAAPLAAEERKPFQPEDLFSIVLAKSPAVSPDGKTVAYVREGADIQTDDYERKLWLVDLRSGTSHSVGRAGEQESGGVWSPDGKTLAYVASAKAKDGEKTKPKPKLMALNRATGVSRLIAELPERPSKITWSLDGSTLAYTAFVAGEAPKLGTPLAKPEGAKWAEPLKIYERLRWQTDDDGVLKFGGAQVFTIPAAGGTPRQITEGDHPLGSLAFAADGRSLIATSNREDDPDHNPEGSDVWRFPLDGGAPQRLVARPGDDSDVMVSLDGRLLAWIGTEKLTTYWATPRLWVANSDGTNARALTASLDAPVSSPRWDAKSRSLLAIIGERGRQVLARIGLDGKVTRLTDALGGDSLDRPYSSGAYSSGGGTIAFTTSDATHPGELAVLDKGKPKLLTDFSAPLNARRALATIRPLKVTSKRDGAAIDAWVVLPPDYKPGQKLPTILEIHGGPSAAYGPTFATDMQLYAAAGYAVVYPNARNSTTYGEKFANWTRLDIPFSEYEDFMGTLDAAIAGGFADPDNLFVTGGSYGGYSSAALVGLTHRFRAAAAQKPVIDWNSKMLTTDIAYEQSFMTYDAPPWEKPLETWKNSPISMVGKVTTPTLLVVGSEDRRTPPSQALEFYTALSLRKVPTELVIVPGANHHGFAGRPSQSAARVSAILDWFDRYRKK